MLDFFKKLLFIRVRPCLAVSFTGFPISQSMRLLMSFLSLALSPSTAMESPLLSPQVPRNHLSCSLDKLSSPSLCSLVLQPPSSCWPLVSWIQIINLCLALRTPSVDVVSESNKCWIGGGWHFPGFCSYIQTVTGYLSSQGSCDIYCPARPPGSPSKSHSSGCICSREVLSQGQHFAHVLAEFRKLPIHPASTRHSGWQLSPRAN